MSTALKVILLVEDDWMLASHWRSLLEREGYRVIHESQVEPAIETLRCVHIDLVITDIIVESAESSTTREGGLEVISYVALNMEPRPKLIAISGAIGHSHFVDKNFGKLDAMRALRKPVSDSELITVVKSALAEQVWLADPAAGPAPIPENHAVVTSPQRLDADVATNDPSDLEREVQRRRISERELRGSVELLRALQYDLRRTQFVVDQSADAVFWFDENGEVLYVNEAACSMLKYSGDELLDSSIMALEKGCTPARWSKRCSEIKQGEHLRFETQLADKTDALISVEISLYFYEYGDERFIVAWARDLTEQKKAEAHLSTVSQSRLAMLNLLGVTDGVWDWDILSGEMEFAPGFYRLLGLPPSDEANFPSRFEALIDHVHPSDRQGLRSSIDSSLLTQEAFTHEFRLQRIDGEYIWARTRGMAVFESDGTPVRMVASTHDITEIVLAQRALRQSQAALDAAADSVFWMRQDATIAYVNETACQQRGYSRDELLQLSVDDLHQGGLSRERFENQIWTQLQSTKRLVFESEHRHKNGETFAVEIASTLIEFGDEKFACLFVRDISERIENQKLLSDAQEKLQLAVTAGNIGLWDWYIAGQEAYFSPEWHRQLGEEPETLHEYSDLVERIHPSDLARVETSMQDYLGGASASYRESYRVRHRDNSWRWMLSLGRTVESDSDGNPTRFSGCHVDITNEKLSEQEQERFFSIAVDLFAILDLETGKLIKTSPNWTELTGDSQDNVLLSSWESLYHQEDQKVIERALGELKQGQPVRDLVVRIKCEEGQYRILEQNITAPQEGESIAFLTARDVTENETQLFRSMAQVVPQTLYIYDLQRREFVFQSRDIAAFMGSGNQVPSGTDGSPIERLAREGDRDRIRSHYRQLEQAEDDRTFEIDFRVQSPQGKPLHFVSRDSVFRRLADGTVQQIVGSINNVDEFEILKRYASDLEQANSELARFAYVASHDLRQPLRSIDNLAKWIQEDADSVLPEESKEHLQLILERIQRMDHLVNDLLTYSRAGRKRSKTQEVNLKELVGKIIQDHQLTSDVELTYSGEALVLQTVLIELEMVLRNLIGNAVKHTADHSPRLEFAAKVINDRVSITLKDNGPGIAPEHQEQIFEMFQTLRSRDEVEGSGMGLAIVRKLVNVNDGEIAVTSDVGEGATFQFTWPLHCNIP